MTNSRRTATAADATVGSVVFKGAGKVAYRVTAVGIDAFAGAIAVTKATNRNPQPTSWQAIAAFTVES